MFSSRTQWNLEPNRLSRLADARRAAGGLIDLTVSNPTHCGFDYDRPAILSAIGQSAALRYEPDPRGLAAARRAVAAYYAERGVTLDEGRVFLTPGTSEAYAHLFRLLCETGDAVLAPSPSYPLFDLLADLNDVRLATYPLLYDHGWHVDTAALRAAIEASHPRALLAIHPNNPTGSYLKSGEWDALQGMAGAANAAVIVDEVFYDFPLLPSAVAASQVQVCLDYPHAAALTFALNGLSKTAALPQMKLGWIAIFGPPELAETAARRLEVIHDTYLSVDTPVQYAVEALLGTRHAMQAQIRERTARNLATLDRLLKAHPGVVRLDAEGGWNIVVRLPRVHTDEEWAELLLERAGVLTHPGHFYAFAREAHLVLSLLPPADVFALGIERLLAALAAELTA